MKESKKQLTDFQRDILIEIARIRELLEDGYVRR